MRIYADIFDAAGNRLGDGPIKNLKSASVTRPLDGVGQIKFKASASDPRALSLIQNERRVELWGKGTGGLRLLGEGIIRNIGIGESSSGATLDVSGPDIMDELKRRNTLLARIFNQVTILSLASSLIALVPGWSVSVDASIASNIVDGRYDGVSVLAAFQDIASRYGVHLRISSTSSKTLEIGPFGDDNGLRIFKTETVTQEMLSNPNLLMVQQIKTSDDSHDLYNWILPIGAGEGTAGLTLEKSTRTTPYTIQNMAGPDGTTLYYIADATSVATNGQIEKIAQFKDVAPLTNSETDIVNAANALYDATVEWLLRHKDNKLSYNVTVPNVKQSIAPGDKIHMNYKATVTSEGQTVDYLDIRDDFWVLKATENIGLASSVTKLEISNIDRRTETIPRLMMDSINSIELRNLKPGITSSARSYVYDREIAPAADGDGPFNADVPIEFTDATMTLERVRLRLKTSPFRSTSQTAIAGGGSSDAGTLHRHVIFTFLGGATAVVERLYQGFAASGTPQVRLKGPSEALQTATDQTTHTHEIDHEHDLDFGISDDTQTPIDVTVFVNGMNKTFELFGSSTLAPGGGNLDIVADSDVLTGLINNAGGGLRRVHDITIKCANGQGRAEVTVEIFEVTQAIKI